MERTVTVRRLSEPDEPWRYWRTRPMAERLAMVEELRREHHGWSDGAEPRLQRVHRVLHVNKLATGRLRDLADVEDLGLGPVDSR